MRLQMESTHSLFCRYGRRIDPIMLGLFLIGQCNSRIPLVRPPPFAALPTDIHAIINIK